MDSWSDGEAQESSGEGVTFGAATSGVVHCRRSRIRPFLPTLKKTLTSFLLPSSYSLYPPHHAETVFRNGELRTQRRRLGDREAGDVSVERGIERRMGVVNSSCFGGDAACFFFFHRSRRREGARMRRCFFFFFRPWTFSNPAAPLAFCSPTLHDRVEWSVLDRLTQSRRKTLAIGGSSPRVKNASKWMSPALFFLLLVLFPLTSFLYPGKRTPNKTKKTAPRPSAPSRPWERTPCSATPLQCSREERLLREEQLLGTPPPPREEQQQRPPRRTRGRPAALRGLEQQQQRERRRPLPPRPRASPRARSRTTRSSGPSTR